MIPIFNPPYVFQEYPKALYHPVDGTMTLVADLEEECAVRNSWPNEKPKNKGGRPRKAS